MAVVIAVSSEGDIPRLSGFSNEVTFHCNKAETTEVILSNVILLASSLLAKSAVSGYEVVSVRVELCISCRGRAPVRRILGSAWHAERCD
jgi:hypothetical protein